MKVGGGYSLELSLWVQDDRETPMLASGGKHIAKTAPGPARLTRAKERNIDL